MKIIKISLTLVLSLVWILFTNYSFFPINNLGTLLSYKSGLLGLEKDVAIRTEINSGKELTISIDSFGIPYIYSRKDKNLAYGLGFMHAKDRYFQMELMTLMVKGQLSEVFGENVVDLDRFWKPFEFERKSKEIFESYKTQSPELYSFLLSYSDGVNKFLIENKLGDPLYKIFDLQPKKWKPEYSILIIWYMSRNLSYFDYHLERQNLIDKLPENIINVLYPLQPNGLKTILPTDSLKNKDSVKKKLLTNRTSIITKKNESSEFIKDIGSNNWVINSKKAKASFPLLVNDPHLFLTLPEAFYEACLMGDKIKVYGYTIPGVPLIISGHNTTISWGITNGEWDLTDTYLLETKKDSFYLYEGNWIPFEIKKYPIQIRGKGEIEIDVKKTIHGIVQKNEEYYLAQKWYPSRKNNSIEALFNIMYSQNYSDFKEALKIYSYPPQNFVYADVNDTIGIVCAGKLPKRPLGYNGGLLDGTKEPIKEEFISRQWETNNPDKNYLFSANQLPIKSTYYFGAHWHKDDYRVNRIDQLLKEKDDWDIDDMKNMQLDEIDLSFYHLKLIFKDFEIEKKYSYLIRFFSDWDGKITNNSSKENKIFDALTQGVELESERFAKNKLKVTQIPSMKSFLDYLNCDLFKNEKNSSKEKILKNILKSTDSILKSKKNNANSKLYIKNISFLPGFEYIVSDLSGNKNTINMNASANPVFRSLYQMKKDGIIGFTILAGGQSGLINSKNYTDQLNNWTKGKYKKVQFEKNMKNLQNITTTLFFK